ncbi:2,4-dihydroxyhept-2-ene-1,7-dioic acid aldolase [Candidatus Parcubacteria bacterium]|nr:MAG: 2,4-dihydroxyhept-2-ene-1,7-dioic acid aldolase [Candidatus Parcubacteria bacterium]
MLASKIKEKMRRGEASLGTWMSMAHPSIAEILAMAGYDWVVIETEHTAIDVSEVLRLIIAIEQRGSIPLVRLAWNDPIQAKAVLDSGAAGVLVPMVNSKADAELAVQMTKYPPLGFRGVGLARAQGYGENFDAYVQNANANTLLIVQIEHKDALANIEEILSVPGIDGTFIGPYDLSLSLGIPGQISHPEVLAAKRRVLDSTLAHGLIAGVHFVQPRTAADDCRQAVTEGYRFIALGTDILFLGDSARALQKETCQFKE